MNNKTRFLMPIMVAVFAFVLIATVPSALAGTYADEKREDTIHDKDHKFVIEGFTGQLQLTENTDKHELKEMITVSLSEAASGLDVIKGELEIIANENDEKFLVWKLKSVEKDPDSDTKIKTIHIVDAANADNTTTITKEYDYSMKDDSDKMSSDKMSSDKMSSDKMSSDKMNTNTMSSERPISTVATTDPTDLRGQFVDKIQELQEALTAGDAELVSQIRQELNDLKNDILQSIAT